VDIEERFKEEVAHLIATDRRVPLAFVIVLWNAGKDESRSSTKITASCVKKTSRVNALTTMCGLKKFQLGVLDYYNCLSSSNTC
jgi:hypothetical protein